MIQVPWEQDPASLPILDSFVPSTSVQARTSGQEPPREEQAHRPGEPERPTRRVDEVEPVDRHVVPEAAVGVERAHALGAVVHDARPHDQGAAYLASEHREKVSRSR